MSLVRPVLPDERLYNETPSYASPTLHDPVGCTKNCYDFNPLAANLSDAYDDDATGRVTGGCSRRSFGLPDRVLSACPIHRDRPRCVALAFITHLAAGSGIFFAVATLVRTPPGRLPATSRWSR
ncbi:MAG: hypothetical protein IPI44_07710 [Sulfuritalea sp.]|nr:hypothetical protein [Sulfuritalea sp.]